MTFEGAAKFENNTCSSDDGGALYVNSGTTATFESTVEFFANSAVLYGGGVYAAGYVTFEAAAKFENNTCSNSGGALCIEFGGTATFKSAGEFFANSAVDGGAVFVSAGEVTFEAAAKFEHNSCSNSGGALRIDGESFAASSGGSGVLDGTVTFERSVSFIGNHGANSGGAVYVGDSGILDFLDDALFIGNSAAS